MRHIKVRTSLIVVLIIFAAMILFDGIAGIAALKRADANAKRLREVASHRAFNTNAPLVAAPLWTPFEPFGYRSLLAGWPAIMRSGSVGHFLP
jgi:hypothetical protein